jgi:hypothetical protein
MDRKLGAIHVAPPPAIRPLSMRASLSAMTVPKSADWFAKCPADGYMLGNDAVGDCVPCAQLRAIQVRRAVAWDDTWTPTKDMALALYAALTGFDPATLAGDKGTNTAQAMAAWSTGGYRVDDQNLDVVCWAKVDPVNDDHIAIAIAHTGPLQVTLALPKAAEDITTWSKAPGTGAGWEPGSWGAHRVTVGMFYGRDRMCRTWGEDELIHPDFWSAYVLAVDATLSREWLDATGLAPIGLDWDALAADVAGLQMAA